MIAVLLIGGFFRSLQFTATNTIAYADVDARRMSRATSLVSVAQQLSIAAGVAVGALAVELAVQRKGGGAITAEDFRPAFLLVGADLGIVRIVVLVAAAGRRRRDGKPHADRGAGRLGSAHRLSAAD